MKLHGDNNLGNIDIIYSFEFAHYFFPIKINYLFACLNNTKAVKIKQLLVIFHYSHAFGLY
jgi:hypothetical protein